MGTVVLPPDANLPDGTEVRVEPLPAKPLSERLSDVIGIVHGGPPTWRRITTTTFTGRPKSEGYQPDAKTVTSDEWRVTSREHEPRVPFPVLGPLAVPPTLPRLVYRRKGGGG